jgi:hypothetical protein
LTAHFEFEIKYELNGGLNPSIQPKNYRNTDTEGANSVTIEYPTRYGYIFDGFTVEFLVTDFAIHNIATPTKDIELSSGAQGGVKLIASWSKDPSVTFIITYNGNGHTGGSAPVDSNSGRYLFDDTVSVMGVGSLTKTNHNFLGWAKSNSAITKDYSEGDIFTINADTTLYAVWQKLPDPPVNNASGGSGSSSLSRPPLVSNAQGTDTDTDTDNTVDGGKSKIDSPYKGDPTDVKPNSTVEEGKEEFSGLSLVLGLLSLLISIFLLWTMIRRKELTVLKVCATVLGLVPITLCLILDDITAELSFANTHTALILGVVALHLIASAVAIGLSRGVHKDV